jgi:hypothetical protein
MPNRDRRSALRAVSAAIGDAEGKLGALDRSAAPPAPPEPAPEPVAVTLVPETAPEAQPIAPPRRAEQRSAPKAKPAPEPPASEDLLPSDWLQRIDDAKQAEAVDVGGERVRRRVEEETVYLAVRVPRSLRDAVRRRSDRLDVSIQEFVVHAAQMLLEATARAAFED